MGELSLGLAPPTYQLTSRPFARKLLSKDPPTAFTHRNTVFFHSTQPAYLLNFGGPISSAPSSAADASCGAASCTTPFLPK